MIEVNRPEAAAAIVGIGTTPQGKIPGCSGDEIATDAASRALQDAGIAKAEIDGLVTCKPPRATPRAGTDEAVGQLLGLNPVFGSTLEYGAGLFSVHLAALAIKAGLASRVLLTFGSAARSAATQFGTAIGGGEDWVTPHGLVHIAGLAALAARRHMSLYGTTEEQLGWVAVSQREWAGLNDRAVLRDRPLTIDGYLAEPYVVEPLRRSDLTLVTDGGVAMVVVRPDLADDFRSPVFVHGLAQQTAFRGDQNPDRLLRPWIGEIAARLYAQTGLHPSDIDAAYLQDATSVWVLQMLEAYGFCGVGEAGEFLAAGHTRPDGSLPVNTGGGQLAESYMWNWLNLYEAVSQLRGDCGDRQLKDPRLALIAQTHDFWKGAASVLSTERRL
jgi:acetyl-CoA acetyltransferase